MIGMRSAGPAALGIIGVPWRDFLVFNAIGASCWAIMFTTLGFLFGRTISLMLGRIVHYELQAALAIVVGGLLFAAWRRWRRVEASGN